MKTQTPIQSAGPSQPLVPHGDATQYVLVFDPSRFTAFIRQERERQRFTRRGLAVACGVDWNRIKRIEEGHSLSVDSLVRLAAAFNIAPAALLEQATARVPLQAEEEAA